MSSPSQLEHVIESDELLLMIARFEALESTGLDMKSLKALSCPLSSRGQPEVDGSPPPTLWIGRIRTEGESLQDVQSQLDYLSRVLEVVAQLSPQELDTLVERLFSVGDHPGTE